MKPEAGMKIAKVKIPDEAKLQNMAVCDTSAALYADASEITLGDVGTLARAYLASRTSNAAPPLGTCDTFHGELVVGEHPKQTGFCACRNWKPIAEPNALPPSLDEIADSVAQEMLQNLRHNVPNAVPEPPEFAKCYLCRMERNEKCGDDPRCLICIAEERGPEHQPDLPLDFNAELDRRVQLVQATGCCVSETAIRQLKGAGAELQIGEDCNCWHKSKHRGSVVHLRGCPEFVPDPLPSQGEQWVIVPDSQGWWWHIMSDSDAAPFMYSILASGHGAQKRLFIAYPDSRWVEDVGGLWARAVPPPAPPAPAKGSSQ